MKYEHLFFDLDHTLWDFDANAKHTLSELYTDLQLGSVGVHDFTLFYNYYLMHNEKLWKRYRNGHIKSEELRWKRMWHTLLEFRIRDEKLARVMGERFLKSLPGRTILFPDTLATLQYLQNKGYRLHLITNGFEDTQRQKLASSGIIQFFLQIVTSEGSNSMKPKKEIFDFALQKAGAMHHHSIMIGDCLDADIQGAQNAGIDQVYMNHTNSVCHLKPTFMAKSLKELQEIF